MKANVLQIHVICAWCKLGHYHVVNVGAGGRPYLAIAAAIAIEQRPKPFKLQMSCAQSKQDRGRQLLVCKYTLWMCTLSTLCC